MESWIKNYALCEIANDYEDFEMIFSEVNKQAPQEQKVNVTREAVALALQDLIREGYARAFFLTPQTREASPVLFSLENANNLWYYVTPEGKSLADTI